MAKPLRQAAAWGREDRDLLIELRTEMQAIRSDLADMKGNYTARILNLESNSVSKIQFDDHEKRIRVGEGWRMMIIGALFILQLEIPLVIFLASHFWK